MLIKSLVFRRQKRVNDLLRDCRNGHEHPFLTRILGQQGSITSVYACHRGRFVMRELLIIGEAAAELVQHQ